MMMSTLFWHFVVAILGLSEALVSSSEGNSTAKSVETNTNIERSTENVILQLKQELGLSNSNMTTLSQPVISSKSVERVNRWRRHHRGKRHHKESRVKRLATSSPSAKRSSIFSSMSDEEKDKLKMISSTHYHMISDSTRPITSRGFQFEKNKVENMDQNNPIRSGTIIKSKSTEQSRQSCLNDPKTSDSQSSCNEHQSSNSPIDFSSSVSPKDLSSTQDSFQALLAALNASTSESVLKSTTNSSSTSEKNLNKSVEPSAVTKETTRNNFIIVDGLGFFGDGIENLPNKHEDNFNHKPGSIFDILINENNDIPSAQGEIKRWNLWDVEMDRTERIEPDMFTKNVGWTAGFPDRYFSSWRFNDNIRTSRTPAEQSNVKTFSKKIEDHGIINGNTNCAPAKVHLAGDFQSTFLSTFYISITACVVLFAIGLWWRRISKTKKVNLRTLSDSVPLSSTRRHGQLVI